MKQQYSTFKDKGIKIWPGGLIKNKNILQSGRGVVNIHKFISLQSGASYWHTCAGRINNSAKWTRRNMPQSIKL